LLKSALRYVSMVANIDALLPATYIFLGIFGFASLVFIALGFWSLRKVFAARSWRAVPGRTVAPTESMLEAGNGLPVVAYDYTVGGKSYQSTQVYVRLVRNKALYDAARRFPVGVPVRVYYNPKDPAQTVLERYGYENLRLPGIFLLIGVMLFLISLIPFGVLLLSPLLGLEQVVGYLPGGTVAGVIALIGLAVFVAGAGLLVRVWLARGWYPAFGQVLKSGKAWFSDVKGGQAEHPVIVYEYMVNGRTHQNNTIFAIEPVGKFDPAMIVEKYPAGEQTTIYFNPNNPVDAALERPGPLNFMMPIGLLLAGLVVLAVSVLPVVITFMMQRAS
jgi:hypothetical protein